MSLAATPLVTSTPCPRHYGKFHPRVLGVHIIQYTSESLLETKRCRGISFKSLVASRPVTRSPSARRSGDFHPSIWGDHFIQYASESLEVDEEMQDKSKILKEEVRKMLILPTERLASKVHIIDSIQRSGVDYHFELEIDDILQQIHASHVEDGIITLEEDLHTLALLFRLLRQHGYRISPGVFEKYMKDDQDNIKEGLTIDVEQMLSLYEAAHLRVHGEDILDEVLIFTSTHLESMINHLSPSLAAKVNHSLKHPLRYNNPRLEAWHFISCYQDDPSHNGTLLAFAKLEFNILQMLHQKEVGNISVWWKELDFARKLPFARNRLVECYNLILGVYSEPFYSLARRICTKVLYIVTVLDDIYDTYGTLEELQLLTTAIERWDITCMEFLPEYMKFFYQALLDIYEEIEQEMIKEGRTFCVKYAKDEMKRTALATMVQAKWFDSNYTPTMEEYMRVGRITSLSRLLTTTCFIGMGSIAIKEVFQWVISDPKIIKALEIYGRLVNDIMGNEYEQKRGHVASAIQCYMKQHGVKKKDAIDQFNRQMIRAWKDINEGMLNPTEVAKPLLMRVLNICRVADVTYKDADGFTYSAESTKDHITALLLNPFSL